MFDIYRCKSLENLSKRSQNDISFTEYYYNTIVFPSFFLSLTYNINLYGVEIYNYSFTKQMNPRILMNDMGK